MQQRQAENKAKYSKVNTRTGKKNKWNIVENTEYDKI